MYNDQKQAKQSPKKNTGSTYPALFALAADKSYIGASVALAWVRVINDEYSNNKEHYKNMLKFNLCNGIKNQGSDYKRVNFADLSPRVSERISKLYKKCSRQQYYNTLNIEETATNRTMPLEVKYAYEYFKKYKTMTVSGGGLISDAELLRPLSAAERKECSKMF